MARTRAAVRGRERELAVLRAASAADGGRLIVLRGPAGIGRTALLDETERMLRADGFRVLPVRLGDAGPDGRGHGHDAFALAPLVRTVRDRFEQFQESGLAVSLSTVARLSDTAGRDAGGWTPSMVTALDNLFESMGRQGRTAILADDAQAVPEPAPLLTAARRSGCLVLATCEESAEREPGLAELLAAADEVVTLGPLPDDIAESLVRRAPGTRLDEAVPGLLRSALGPLFGNPGTVLGTLADLRSRGRLTAFRGRLCLRAPAEPIELPPEHHLLRRVASLGDPAGRLLSSVAVWHGVGVDDLPLLAEVLDADLTDCGRALDQLIDAEVLVADPAGRLRCRCPALAAAARGPGTHGAAALHASIVERLLARPRQHGGTYPLELADHIAHGGTSVTLDADRITWLLGLAAAAEREQPERAALWCAAVLRRLPPSGPQHAPALTRLLNLVVRTGQYELLREPLVQYAEHGCAPSSLPEIRHAAVLVALHSGEVPAEAAVRALLDQQVTGREPVGFAQWWFGRRLTPGEAAGERGPADPAGTEEPVSAARMDLLSSALSGDLGGCERAWRGSGRAAPSPRLDQLHCAASVVDVAGVMRLVLGARYRVPATGVLGGYRRVVHDYGGADWAQAMSAVRELELSASADTLAHHAARLLAADMCAARGEFRQAAQWLHDAAPAPGLAVLRAWARIGLYSRGGDDARAVRLARRLSPRLRRAGPHAGLFSLLTRAVRIAASTDDEEGAAELLEEIELLRRETGTDATESLLLARGLVHRDVQQVRSAVDLARGRGDLPAVLDSCLAVARFAEDPRPWLREAHGLAKQCDASVLLEQVRAVTRERGVPAPRARGRRDAPAVTERRIVELIGEGLTNRQIALRLRISEKTVENYLTRLFARTGYRSRVELAAASLGGRLAREVT
uniref:helix-turn-helix transcriptional regulator n=1 Tax=Streptomyces poriticola TaxID=3120506 RepID=UPI002FCE2B79